ncbi:MAG: endonuclease/exonuclease/phosphatase family protein [Deltaproteobacteria bacterium]|nr:endonuclease/exonuclease/phosphatase family protein [Deltaproteobacteria bacterium]
MPRHPIAIITALGLASASACGPQPDAADGPTVGTQAEELHALAARPVVRVISRNLYVGANVDLVIGALATPDPSDDLPTLVGAIETFMATDVVARMGAVAREIDLTDADVVGLQEVFYVNIQIPGVASAEADFLQILLAQLAARGLEYDAVVVQNTTDANLPGLRLLDRDAILVRRSTVVTHEVDSALFSINEGDPGTGFEIVRAWSSAVLTVEGHTMQLLNAHLASGNGAELSGLRTLQAVELMTHARTDMPVVLTGDLNDVPDSGMHSTITGAGFADVWATLVPWSSGETCCHADDLSNPRAELSTRIDYVMARGFAHGNRAVRGAILRLGLWSFEKVEGPFFPIWPSDHAGLWARLTLP